MTSSELTPPLVDFHCHLDLYPKPHAVAEHAQRDQVAVLSVTTTPSAFNGTAKLAASKPAIRTALGLHPELAQSRRHELDLFDDLLPSTQYVGEVGLDGSTRFKETRHQQREVFDHILRSCSVAGGRIISIHSRAAVVPVLAALAKNPDAGTPVLHWLSAKAHQTGAAVAQGCWFSINLSMLSTPAGRDMVSTLPRDRVLTETDGPFTLRNGRASQPRDVLAALEGLALLWRLPKSEAADQVATNLRTLNARH
jgi:TatD DNase family protein